MTFAIDFDGTLTKESQYPITGAVRPEMIAKAKALQAAGHTLILHTARIGEDLESAVALCAEHNLYFDSVHGGKPRADAYVDDKNLEIEKFLLFT